MIIRRAVLLLVLILFASLTIGVIVGLDSSARSAIVGQLIGSPSAVPTPAEESESSPPKKAATPKPRATVATPTAAPTPTAHAEGHGRAEGHHPGQTPSAKPARPTVPAETEADPEQAEVDQRLQADGPGEEVLERQVPEGPAEEGPRRHGLPHLRRRPEPLHLLDPQHPRPDRVDGHLLPPRGQRGRVPARRRRIRAQGSKVANHSYDHPDLTTRTAAQLKWQIKHGPKAKCFRPPYGATNAAVRKAIAKAGLREVLWSVDTLDWTKPGVTTLAKTGRLKSIGNGTIVLMHDGGGDRTQTVAALPRVIADLHARGYQVRALPYC